MEEIHFDAILHDSHDEDQIHLKPIDFPHPMFGIAIEPAIYQALFDEDVTDIDDVLRVADKALASLREPIEVSGRYYHVSGSAGITLLEGDLRGISRARDRKSVV